MCSVVKFYGLLIYLLHFCSNLFNSFDTSKQGRVSLDFNQFVYCSEFLIPVSSLLLLYLALHFRWHIFLELIEIDTFCVSASSYSGELQDITSTWHLYMETQTKILQCEARTFHQSNLSIGSWFVLQFAKEGFFQFVVCETRLLAAILLEFLQDRLFGTLCKIYNNPGMYI